MPIHAVGIGKFWGGPVDERRQKEYDYRHQLNRICPVCGAPVCDTAKGNLCRTCRTIARMDPWVQRQVARYVERSLEKKREPAPCE